MSLRLNGSTSGYTEIDAPAVAGSNTVILPGSNGSANQFLKNGSTAGTLGWSSMVEDSSGRLLVGTSSSSASAALVVQGNSAGATEAGQLYLQCDQTNPVVNSDLAYIRFADGNGSVFAHILGQVDAASGTNDYPGRLVFATTSDNASSPTERARITNLGALKASTTGDYSLASNAVHELRSNQNNRTVWISNTNASPYGLYVKYEGSNPNGTDNEFLVCDANGTVRASIRSNGGLANFSANNANLSDRNAKKDISPAAGTWDCVKEWEIVNYRYKDQPDDADLNLGVIAQQVAESCPEVITVFSQATEDEPEKLGVKEQQMYWMAIKALQEAQQRIETLEASNADLAARLTALEAA